MKFVKGTIEDLVAAGVGRLLSQVVTYDGASVTHTTHFAGLHSPSFLNFKSLSG